MSINLRIEKSFSSLWDFSLTTATVGECRNVTRNEQRGISKIVKKTWQKSIVPDKSQEKHKKKKKQQQFVPVSPRGTHNILTNEIIRSKIRGGQIPLSICRCKQFLPPSKVYCTICEECNFYDLLFSIFNDLTIRINLIMDRNL